MKELDKEFNKLVTLSEKISKKNRVLIIALGEIALLPVTGVFNMKRAHNIAKKALEEISR